MYQPIPFPGYEGFAHVRGDCGERFKAIHKNVDFNGLTVIDYGCAEGYMGFRALQEGAKNCTFIDTDDNCLKVITEVAEKHGISNKVYVANSIIGGNFDVCISLSLLYHPKDLTLRDLADMCDVLIVSPAGNGDERNPMLEEEAKKIYENIVPIHHGYENRRIYKCWQKKN